MTFGIVDIATLLLVTVGPFELKHYPTLPHQEGDHARAGRGGR
jgi:hypothetical protein